MQKSNAGITFKTWYNETVFISLQMKISFTKILKNLPAYDFMHVEKDLKLKATLKKERKQTLIYELIDKTFFFEIFKKSICIWYHT